MDWQEIEALIREERKAGNPVARLVHSLQLDVNRATLLLANTLDGEVRAWRRAAPGFGVRGGPGERT